jgi:hypothetical protein
MPEVTVTTTDLQAALSIENAEGIDQGHLDSNVVWYEFLTQNDDRVRPSHRALHGTVWRVGDVSAPVPPLDYGCRCFIRYVAKPGSEAEKILPPAPSQPTTQAKAWGKWLDDKVPTWDDLVKAAMAAPVEDRLPTLALSIQKATGKGLPESRDLARMALATEQQGAKSPASLKVQKPVTPAAPAPPAPLPVVAPSVPTETVPAPTPVPVAPAVPVPPVAPPVVVPRTAPTTLPVPVLGSTTKPPGKAYQKAGYLEPGDLKPLPGVGPEWKGAKTIDELRKLTKQDATVFGMRSDNAQEVRRNRNYSGELAQQMTDDQKIGVKRFTKGYDRYIRMLDRGATLEEVAKDMIDGAKRDVGPLKNERLSEREALAMSYAKMADEHRKDLLSGLAAQERVPRWKVLYRGMSNLTDEQTLAFLQSDEVGMGAVSSTSNTFGVAVGFATRSQNKHAVILRMKDTLGAPIKSMSEYDSEDEVLVTKDQKWKITGVNKTANSEVTGDLWFVDLEPIER